MGAGLMAPDERIFRAVCLHFFRIGNQGLYTRLWRALCRDKRSTTWRYQLGELARQGTKWPIERYKSWLEESLSPHAVVAFTERAVASKNLRRAEANQVQEAILQKTDASGNWR
jgi:hypothetical protein